MLKALLSRRAARPAPLRLSSAEIIDKLHFARSLGKRLDEHRLTVTAALRGRLTPTERRTA